MSGDLHPVVAEVAERQFATLKIIFTVMAGLELAMLVVTLAWALPVSPAAAAEFDWLVLLLAGLAALLLGLVLPLARRRLMGTERLAGATREELMAAGLPDQVDLRIGRQAVFLTRYTAGCVISWGLCAAVSLYGLVARMMGAATLAWAGFFALAVFLTFVLPPDRARLGRALRSF